MTSYPPAISFVAAAVKSLLAGSVLPDKLVLYVTLEEFKDRKLPDELLELEKSSDIFEIRDYGRNIRSYRKLVPALDDFPESIIVTVDDDVVYHKNMLRDLITLHEKYPKDIIAHRAKRISPDKPYKKWKKYRWYHFLSRKIHNDFSNLQTGVAGVLYPPHALKKEMIDPALFMEIAPTADDIWFWAAAVANGRKIIPVPFGKNKPKSLGKPRELSLKAVNFKGGTDRNKIYFDDILNKYPDIKKRIDDEKL